MPSARAGGWGRVNATQRCVRVLVPKVRSARRRLMWDCACAYLCARARVFVCVCVCVVACVPARSRVHACDQCARVRSFSDVCRTR
jgi:hypothetical protein